MPACRIPFFLASIVLVVLPLGPAAAGCEAKSGDSTAGLLELYTSEGCSSCPPTDRWVASLPRDGYGKNRLVPLAFHVDYWNDLGWIDPFSQIDFTRRQREFADRTNAATIYTPELILQGREYRRWWGNSFERALARINATPARADIALRIAQTGKRLQVDGNAALRPGNHESPAALYVAVYENNLSNEVRAGENSGRRLSHAFVVRRLYGPLAFDAGGQTHFSRALPLDDGWKIPDLGVAAFVQETRGTQILQALALDVCP